MGMYDIDPTVPIPELLNNIKQVAASANSGGTSPASVAIPLGTLFARLSTDAEQTAKSVNSRTLHLIIVTYALIALTVLLVLNEVVKRFSE